MKLKRVYNDGTIEVRRRVHPPAWDLIVRPAATCLPILDNGKFLLIHDQKVDGRVMVGFPGGMIEGDEGPKRAAQRECEEEVGLIPKRLKKFAVIETNFPSTSVTYFLGRNCKAGERKPWGEVVAEREVTYKQLIQMAMNAELTDPRLIKAVLLLKKEVDAGKIKV
ncbi:MAG: NUDIX hydrolase [Parcubacteria group bacterium]|nr:NUDIX hydrolase [Parcubacteria group bacterium]